MTGTIRRAAILPGRYGLGSSRLRARLMLARDMAERWGAKFSLPVTAVTLQEHPEILADLRGFDLAIHGYLHRAYAALSDREQAEDLDAALRVFSRCDLTAPGFRSPYLAADGRTLRLLSERGFLYDSSQPVFVFPRQHTAFAKLAHFAEMRYGASLNGGVSMEAPGTLVELPVALPDDEILVDALGITSQAVLERVYASVLETAFYSQQLLVLQVHPERAHIVKSAIEKLLTQAADRGAWITSLEAASTKMRAVKGGPVSWPRGAPIAVCLSGDLDAVSLLDFRHRALGV